ncbi:MAG: hypothetical protein OXB86_03545 [Bdellovibrionales bacterium]|nr:hypothetical protein [Bdellovibrionales bacterium]
MYEIHTTYKDKIYSGNFEIKGDSIIVHYNGRKKGTRVMGSPENIKANETLAKQLLEDLIRPPNERPTYLRG